ncbi:MAG TPA: (2Fe-2S)-binding protein [Gaiellaceae bacterium]
MPVDVEFGLNGRIVRRELEASELLIDTLREGFGLKGTKRSCDVQVCGACTVLVDGLPYSSCCTLSVDVAGREVMTIEGFAEQPGFVRFESAFARHSALQCGFCTPGMLLTAKALLEQGAFGSPAEIRESMSGNLCRCTGYKSILDTLCELAGLNPE